MSLQSKYYFRKKRVIETDFGRPLTTEEEQIIDEHTEIVMELYKLDKRRKELVQKIVEMRVTIKKAT